MEEQEVQAWLNESHVKLKNDNTTVHTWFVRLVPRGVIDGHTISNISLDDCYIDLDETGKLIGVNLAWIEEHEE